ncbi:ParA family protein [Glaciecola sp. XM2]|uniref:ParA family protein n=1 Tax=Glaciecola sp. XM2 TaxID=1914931 RepID=UPI001BDF662C|nr:ParA family protein [Glaciecola sp. XM2]MBT1450845.1 ParA family protein [Glaciecola sp. XM2]
MKIWTVVNQKGGVGKTTTTVSMAGSLSAQGYKVLLIDLDPHASLTYYLGYDAETLEKSVYDVFVSANDNIHPNASLHKTSLNNITLMPAHMALATLDKSFGSKPGKGLVIKKALDQLQGMFDVVIIDCPPVLGVLMVNGLVAADKIIIPTQTEHLAIRGLQRMLDTIRQLTGSLKASVMTLVVATLFDRRVNACIATYTGMRSEFNTSMWRGYIPVDTKFREASQKGVPINVLSPQSRGAFAYDKLTNELLKDAV